MGDTILLAAKSWSFPFYYASLHVLLGEVDINIQSYYYMVYINPGYFVFYILFS